MRRVVEEDVAVLARVLARAFYDDPPARWLIPDDRKRLPRLEHWFTLALAELYLPYGHCYTTDELAGAALWVPPPRPPLGPAALVRLLPHGFRIFGVYLPRNLIALRGSDVKHPREPHYYLPFMGVDPKRQGEGLGTELMDPVLRRCDHDRSLAYLEASSPRNRRLYERHGFRVTADARLGSGPPIWPMVRRAR